MRTTTLLTIALLFLFGCAVNTAEYFQWAQHKDTIYEYKDFLAKYPDSPEAPLAKKRLEELEYSKATNSERYSQLQRFIQLYPNSPLIDSAKAIYKEYVFRKLDQDSIIHWNAFGATQHATPDCICRISSSIASSQEQTQAFDSLLFSIGKKSKYLSGLADMFEAPPQRSVMSKPEFSWTIHPDRDDDFFQLEYGALSPSRAGINHFRISWDEISLYMESDSGIFNVGESGHSPRIAAQRLSISSPASFHSKSGERVFRTQSGWILAMLVLDGHSSTNLFYLRGVLASIDGSANSVDCGLTQVYGTLRFPRDYWVPIFHGIECMDGGATIDTVGVRILSGTTLVFRR